MKRDITLILSWRLIDSQCGTGVTLNNYIKNYGKKNSYKLIGDSHNQNLDTNIIAIKDHSSQLKKGRRFARFLLYPLKVLRVLAEVRKIGIKKIRKVSVIYPNYEYLFIGYLISFIYKKPLDIWFHNTYADNTSGINNFFASKIESIIVKKTNKFYVLTDALKDHYDHKYPFKETIILRHGFNTPLLADKSDLKKDSLCFGITGTINASNFDATSTIIEFLFEIYDCKIKIFGKNENIVSNFKKFDKEKLIFEGFLEENDFYSKIKKIDILLLCHGFQGTLSEVEYRTIFPTRLVPYLNFNKPILLFSKKGFYINKFFHDNNFGWIVDEKDKQLLEKNINDICNSENQLDEKLKNAKKTYQLFSLDSNGKIFRDFVS